MAYAFRYYGKNWIDPDEHDIPSFEYCIQFKGPLTVAQRERLAELVERTFADGPAEPNSAWFWAQRFLLADFFARYRFANGAVCGRVTDFLMEARRICPIVDVVCRTATSHGLSNWDQWTLATQPVPDPGPDWAQHASPCGIHQRPVDSALPPPALDTVFEDARERARTERHRQRILDSVSPRIGLSITPIALTDLPPASPDEPAPPDTVPPDARFAPHADGSRAIYVDRDGDSRLVVEIDLPGGAERRRWRCEFAISDLAWLDDLWALRTADTIRLVDPSAEPPALAAEPFGIKGYGLSCVAGRALVNTHHAAPGKASLALLARTRPDKLDRVATLTLSDPLFVTCERQGRIFLCDASGFALHFELHGVAQALADHLQRATPRRATATVSKKKPAVELVPVDALPDDPLPWPDATNLGPPRYLAQRAPDGTVAAFGVTRIWQGHGYHRVDTLRLEPTGAERRVLERDTLVPPGYAFKDLALSHDGRRVAVAAHQWSEEPLDSDDRELLQLSDGFAPNNTCIPNAWCFVAVETREGRIERIGEALLAPAPREDGRRNGYGSLRHVERPGGNAIHLWNKQPYHTMRWLGPDDLLVVFDKGVLWYRRAADGTWSQLAHAKAAGVGDALGAPERRIVAVLGTGKTRLTVFGELDGKVRKLAAFTDNLTAVERRGEHLFARRADGSWCELSGL